MDKKRNPKLIILIGVIFVSFGSIFTRMSSAPSLIIATYRLGFSSIILLPWILIKNFDEIREISKKNLLICIISGIFLALHFLTWMESIRYTSIASSTVLVNTHPIFILIGSFLILKERVSRKAVVSIIVALIGSTVISLGNSSLGSSVLYGDLLAVIGGLCMAGYIMIGRVARKELSVNSYTFIVYSSCTLTLLSLSLITNTSLYPYPMADWLTFLALSIFCTILGHSIFNWALGYLSPAFVSTAVLGEPVFATIWAMIIFKEIATPWQILGGLIILSGIYSFIRIHEDAKDTSG